MVSLKRSKELVSLIERFSLEEVGALRQGISPIETINPVTKGDRMGYESRLYVVNRRELKWDGKPLGIYRDMIAKFDELKGPME